MMLNQDKPVASTVAKECEIKLEDNLMKDCQPLTGSIVNTMSTCSDSCVAPCDTESPMKATEGAEIVKKVPTQQVAERNSEDKKGHT